MIIALIVVTIWGVSFSVVKVGLEELPPLLFVGMRFLIVAFPAVFFVPFPKTQLGNIVGVGLLIGIVKFGLLFIAMKDDANAGMSSLILQSQIFFTIGLSALWFGECVSRRQWIGIALAASGFAAFFVTAGGNITLAGIGLITGAGLAWALANLVMKRMPDVNLLHFMVWVSLVPPVPLLLASYWLETSNPLDVMTSLSLSGWLSLLYMAYLSTLLAYALWGRLLADHAAAIITPFALLIPVIGMLTGIVALQESLSLIEIIGSGLVLIGLVICMGIPARRAQ